MNVAKVVFWGSLGALAWTHVGYPVAAELAARAAPAAGSARRRRRAVRDGDHPRLQRGGRDRAPAREPARARLPGRAGSRSSSPRMPRPTARTRSSRPSPPASRGSSCSTARAAARWRPRTGRCRQASSDVVAFSDGNSTWSPDALRHLVANLADPDVAYVCGQLRLQDAAGTNREGTYWRYEMKLREAESRLGSITGGNGSIYARQARRLRRGRPALGPRPLVPLPDGAGGAARRLRAAGARLREADALERDGVPAQGADVRALLGDHPARLDVPAAAARLPRRDRLAPAAPLRQRHPAPDAARVEHRPRRPTAGPTGSSSPARWR